MTTSLPAGTVGIHYSQPLSVIFGTPPYTWALLPGEFLPEGLALNAYTGIISGTPLEAGTFSFGVHATDSLNTAVSSGVAIVIHGAAPAETMTRSGVFSQVASGAGWKTTMYVVNVSSTPVQVAVNFWTNLGAPLELPLTVTQSGIAQTKHASTLTATLGPHSTMLMESASNSQAALVGWAEVLSSEPVSGYGAFHYTSLAGIESEGTVPLDPATSSDFLLPYESENGFAMGVAVANLSALFGTTIAATAWDANGANLSESGFDLGAGGHTSFMLADQVSAATGNRGFLQFNSTRGPNITGLGLRVNPAGGFTSTMPLVGGTGGIFSHVASGGGWKTSLYLINPSYLTNDPSGSAYVTVNFYDDDGRPLQLPLTVTQASGVQTLTSSTLMATIGPNSTLLIESASSSPTPLTGSAWVLNGHVAGYGVFHYTSPIGVESEGTVPLDSSPIGGAISPSLTLPYDCTNGFGMGVALGSRQSTTVTVAIVDENGAALMGTSLYLAPLGHTSFMLADKIPSAAGSRGFLRIDSSPRTNITAIGLRVNPAGGFTSVPKLQ